MSTSTNANATADTTTGWAGPGFWVGPTYQAGSDRGWIGPTRGWAGPTRGWAGPTYWAGPTR
ncbi:hypothetical protein Nm8I071_17930 [Nonomuraea sp. TT08I-71]|nr:hypothetical protein Nm8I071_17930 [Nonomuraea sp. TT08I-71]